MSSSIKNWIVNKLEETNYDKLAVYKMYNDCIDETDSTMDMSTYKRLVRTLYNEAPPVDVDEDELNNFYVKLGIQNQKKADLNNMLRKQARELYRIEGIRIEKYEEFIQELSETDFSKFKVKEHKTKNAKYGILHWSDHHFNEQILPHDTQENSYSFDEGSKRLKKLTAESISFFKWKGVTDLYIFLTGDLINSNRRISEQLMQLESQVKASLLTANLYAQAIIELSKHFNIHIASVIGNESRMTKDPESIDILATDNYDYLIYQILAVWFRNDPIEFIYNASPMESVVQFPNGFNALLVHGHNLSKNKEVGVDKLLRQQMNRGMKIHGVFFGHLHNALIGDLWSQSSSMSGPNGWTEKDLGYLSRASQNCYVVNDDLSYNGYKVDLMDTESVEGYELIEHLITNYSHYNKGNTSVTINYRT